MATPNIIPIRPQTLRDVAFDLQHVKARLAVHYARVGDPDDCQDAEWSALEDERYQLEQVACAEFQRLTGMSWSMFESIMS